MRLHDKLGRLLQTGAIEGEGGGKAPQPPPGRGWLRVLWVLLGFFAATLGDVALAVVADDTEQMHVLSGDDAIVWQPPNSEEIVLSQAQWGPPVAPFVFDGGVLHVGGSFDASREFQINKRAVVNTHDDVVLAITGRVASQPGSSQGVAKLGAGTLRLSGANDYRGATLLLQGGLDLENSRALGQGYNSLHVNTGTRLRYAPDIIVGNSLQLQDMAIAPYVPAGSYIDVVPGEYADSVQWFVDSGQATQAGALSGRAPVVKQGAGLLRFSGTAMAYAGLFTVNQGTLAMDGMFGGPTQVNGGARLQGVGQVGDTTVRTGGVLAPGREPAGASGQLTVRGDLGFEPGAEFRVRVAPSGWNTALKVTGRALLDGNVMALAQAGDWQETTRYTILHADNGFDDTQFASVDTDMAFLSPSLEYDAQKVYLVLERNGTGFEDVADDGDEDVADAVDDPTDVPDIHDEIVTMTEPQAREALRQLSGDWYGSVQSSIVDDSRFLREAVWAGANPVARRSGSRRRGFGVGGTRSAMGMNGFHGVDRAGGWGYSFFSSARRQAANGVDGDARELGGVVLGLNWPVGSRAGAGSSDYPDVATEVGASAFFGARQSRLKRDAAMANARIRSAHAGVSLSAKRGSALWMLGAAYSRHRIHSTRKVAVQGLRDSLAADYAAHTAQLFGQVQRPFTLPVNRRFGIGAGRYTLTSLTITPFVRATGLRLRTDGFTEGGGSAALAVAGSGSSTVFSTLGVRVQQDVDAPRGDVTLSTSLAWRYAAGSGASQTRQGFRDSVRRKAFTTEGLPLAGNALQLELGLRARVAKTLRLGLSYAGQFASGVRDHGARLDLGWAF